MPSGGGLTWRASARQLRARRLSNAKLTETHFYVLVLKVKKEKR
jgi:hypothetical protein